MANARKVVINLADGEYGNDLMWLVAEEAFERDATLDAVEVREHGGWWLEWNRHGVVIGTANDGASLSHAAYRWAEQFTGVEYAPSIRRQATADYSLLAVA